MRSNVLFDNIIGDNFALGDPGYLSCNNVVAGLKVNQITSNVHWNFDKQSRYEQIKIEHVNSFLKRCISIDKHTQFVHSKSKLCGCVLIRAGMLLNAIKSCGSLRRNKGCASQRLDQSQTKVVLCLTVI